MALLAFSANASEAIDWKLPEQPLSHSLRAVAAARDQNILFDGKLVYGRVARSLNFRGSSDEALARLLAGTGLTYRHTDEETVTVEREITAPAEKPASYQISANVIGHKEPAHVGVLEQVVVTGTDIKNARNSTVPGFTITAEQIRNTGVGTTYQLLGTLPQNFALTSPYGVDVPGSIGTGEQGTAANLRAIGQGTTLLLVNGQRLPSGFLSTAVDVSAFPLSAVEKVEVLTDGASAIYGSDAIGGVINFITRDEYDGAEMNLRVGVADGFDELRASQTYGSVHSSGNAVISLEYYRRSLLSAHERDFVPGNSIIGSLAPEDENFGIAFNAEHDLADSFSVHAFGLGMRRDSYNFSGRIPLNEDVATDNDQYVVTLGSKWALTERLRFDLSFNTARNELDQFQGGLLPDGTLNQGRFGSIFDLSEMQLRATGELVRLPGGDLSLTAGSGYRHEQYWHQFTNAVTSAVDSRLSAGNDIAYGYTEFFIPVVGTANALPWLRRLAVSLAGRYEQHSTAGSSAAPQLGFVAEPLLGLRLHANTGTSFKAPALVNNDRGRNIMIAEPITSANGTQASLLQVSGADANSLKSQKSRKSSIGLEFHPQFSSGLGFSANYYRIHLNQFVATGQRDQGLFPLASFDFNAVGPAVELEERNLSELTTDGFDVTAQYEYLAGAGLGYVSLTGTHILSLKRKVISSSNAVDVVDTIYHPTDLRLRGLTGFSSHGWIANLAVNYADSYLDTRNGRRIGDFLTVDANVSYDFGQRFKGEFLSGLEIKLGVQNLTAEDPPTVEVRDLNTDQGLDPTNANPDGRVVTLEFTMNW